MEGFVKVNGHPVHYVEFGKGFPVFCIHGYAVDWRMMAGCLEPVFEKHDGYRRIYIDLPGHGQTPPGLLKTSNAWLETISGAIDELIGKEQHFLLAGQSYGSYMQLGLHCLRNEQIDGSLFIVPCPMADRPPRQLPEKQFTEYDEEFMDTLPEEWRARMESWGCMMNKRVWRTFEQDIIPGLKLEVKPYTRYIVDNAYKHTYEEDKENGFKNIKFDKPSLWITGKQDHYVGYKDSLPYITNEQFTRSTFVALDGASHLIPNEKEDLFHLLVEDWLYRIEKLQPIKYVTGYKVYGTPEEKWVFEDEK